MSVPDSSDGLPATPGITDRGMRGPGPEAVPLETKVWYSTPFGDTKDGRQKLFLLERSGVRFFPVFRSIDGMKEFYDKANRAAYMVLEGDIESILQLNRSIEPMKTAWIVVDPLSQHPLEIPPTT